MLPHLKLQLLEWGDLSTQIRPAGPAAGLAGSPSPVAPAFHHQQRHQHRANAVWNLSSFTKFTNTWLPVFLDVFECRRMTLVWDFVQCHDEWLQPLPCAIQVLALWSRLKTRAYKNCKCIKRSIIKTKFKVLPLFWNLSKLNYKITPVGLRSTM